MLFVDYKMLDLLPEGLEFHAGKVLHGLRDLQEWGTGQVMPNNQKILGKHEGIQAGAMTKRWEREDGNGLMNP